MGSCFVNVQLTSLRTTQFDGSSVHACARPLQPKVTADSVWRMIRESVANHLSPLKVVNVYFDDFGARRRSVVVVTDGS